MPPRRSRRVLRWQPESLERRAMPAGLSLQADYVNVMLAADATKFPDSTIDVLDNDTGSGIRITEVVPPMVGTVERLPGAGPDGRELLRYVPGAQFRGFDAFAYVATDAAGAESTQHVFVSYAQDPLPYFPWGVRAAEFLTEGANGTFGFAAGDGSGLVTIDYAGSPPARVGVLLRWGFLTDPSLGTFASTAAPADAEFYPLGSAAWLHGSITGVNELLAATTYTPADGFTMSDDLALHVQAHLYTSLNVTIDVAFASMRLPATSRPAPPAVTPPLRPGDGAGIPGDVPPPAAGDMLAMLRPGADGPAIVVMNPETGETVGTFEPFERTPTGDTLVDVADLDGDGRIEVVALNVDRELRMQAFSMTGELLDESVVRPFGGRRVRDLDLAIGDLDDDGRAEMVFAGRTARGFEIRAVDAATQDAEMAVVLRGMTGAPQVAFDHDADSMSVVGRSPGGGLMLATVTDDGAGGTDTSRRLLMSAREMRKLGRAHGGLADVSLMATDVDGNGTSEMMVGLSFRDGSMRAMTTDETGRIDVMADPWSDLDTTRLLVLTNDLGLAAAFPTDGGPIDTMLETPTTRRTVPIVRR